jgi:hypothetical protein
MVLTQFSTPIRVFRAESAGEYISKQLRGVLAKQGTLAQFSCPGAHAQNGVAERKHRHLLETTRAMMIAFSLLPHFLAEAVSTSVYLINIQPSAALQGGIPLERLSDRSPDYSTLRLFGCVCYVLLEGFRSIENKNFPTKTNKNNQDLIYEIQNNERKRLDLHTLVDRTAETFR